MKAKLLILSLSLVFSFCNFSKANKTLVATSQNIKTKTMQTCKTFKCLKQNENTNIKMEGFFRKFTPNKQGKGAGHMFWDWEILLEDSIAIPVKAIDVSLELSKFENKKVSVNAFMFYGIVIGSDNPNEQSARGYRIDINNIKTLKF